MLLEYHPEEQTTTCLLDGLWFANGVAMPADGSFVLVAESHHLRIWRYWLAGVKVRSGSGASCRHKLATVLLQASNLLACRKRGFL